MDYSPIFNKLTRESLQKFVEMNDLSNRVKVGRTKEDFAAGLVELFVEDDTVETRFHQFYLRTEEAGRKHLYLKRLQYTPELKNLILKAAAGLPRDHQRTFDPSADNDKVYVTEDGSSLLVKSIKINKAYDFQGDQEDEKAFTLTKTYKVRLIHFVEFVRFNFTNNTILYGHDAYGDYFDRKAYEKSVESLVVGFIGQGNFDALSSFLNSDKIERLRLLPNCITSSLSNRIRVSDRATFKKAKGDIDQILKEIKQGRYRMDEIKERNPNLDVQTHALFEASFEKSIQDDLDMKNSGLEMYYFSSRSGIDTSFRLKIDLQRDLLMTFSDSVTREELYDVLAKLG